MGKSCQLSEVEREKLQQWTAAHGTPQQVALRCRIVLAAAAGESDVTIAKRLSVNRNTVILWRKRFGDEAANAQTSTSSEPHEYRIPDTSDGVGRVFYLAQAETPQDLQKAASTVRSATKAPRLFTNTDQKALVMRGTPDQIATAERLIDEVR
jgi:Homeodomain-like domain